MNWKKVNGFEYEINDQGQIRNRSGKILKPSDNGRGYKYVTLGSGIAKKRFYVHRLVADAFLEFDETRPDTNHKNGIKDDNRAENLERCNKFENMRHAYDHKLLLNPNAKLSECEVNIIRKMWSLGFHREDIVKVFDISFAQIHRIVNHKNWLN